MTNLTDAVSLQKAPPTSLGGMTFLRRFLRQPLATFGAVFLLITVVSCTFASVLVGDPMKQDLAAVYQGPSSAHWLGTDQLGRDLLTRLLFGGQVTLVAALQATAVFAVLGITLGLVAGAARPIVDAAIMRISDLVQSIPALIILLVVLAIFGQNETAAMVTFGVLASPGLIRIVRTATRAVRAEQFVAAARIAGLSPLQIQLRHVLPAIAGPAMTQISLMAGVAVLVESAIGFLGLGVLPPDPTWGNMLSDAQRAITLHPWMLLPTGGMVAAVSVALTLVGEGVRDAYAARTTRTGAQMSWRQMAATSTADDVDGRGGDSDTAAGPALLTVRDLTVSLPGSGENDAAVVVDGIDLDLRPGEALGIVGESGCGKSMTVTGILRVLPPGARLTAATITLDGRELLTLSEREINRLRGSEIAYISQEPISSLDPAFTAGQQIAEAVRRHRKVSRREAAAIALELLAQVRLPDPAAAAAKYPHELSGGMAQRIAIARALAGQPRVLIADEPTTALDVTVQAEILDLLRDLRQQLGMAMILVTHDWGVLADSCDRAIVMYAGQVVETASVEELVTRPAMPYTRALLRSMPSNTDAEGDIPVVRGSVPAPGSWPAGCRFFARCDLAVEACSTGPVPLVIVAGDQAARCIRVGDEVHGGERQAHGVA